MRIFLVCCIGLTLGHFNILSRSLHPAIVALLVMGIILALIQDIAEAVKNCSDK